MFSESEKLCVQIYVYMGTCSGVIYVGEEIQRPQDVSLRNAVQLLWGSTSLSHLQLTNLASLTSPWDPPTSISPALRWQTHATHSTSLCVLGKLNFGPQACTMSLLPIALCLQPCPGNYWFQRRDNVFYKYVPYNTGVIILLKKVTCDTLVIIEYYFFRDTHIFYFVDILNIV